MAGNLTGADVAQLRDLARQLDLGAQRVRTLGEGVRASLAAAPWTGQRADDYRRRFNGTDLVALRSAVGLLEEAARTLRRNADEQERASSSGGSTGAGGGFGDGLLLGAAGRSVLGPLLRGVVERPDLAYSDRFFPPGLFTVLERLDGASNTTRALLTELARDPHLLSEFLHWQGDVDTLVEAVHLSPQLGLGEAHTGVEGHVEASHHGATADGLFQYDAAALAEASVTADASAKLSSDGLAAAAGVGVVAAVSASAAGRVGTDAVNAHARVAGELKAYADAGGKVQVGPKGADLNAKAEAGVMATVTAGLGTKFGPLTVDAQVQGHAGAGAQADAGLSLTAHKVGFRANVGAAIGLGAGGAVDVSVDPTELADDVAEGAARFWKGIR
ncbi:WXG100 family type VII secretion target [Quadrisphaera oryzae]|uniref:WXG100 family type VII secretion target n=1 Tax=Quadrisphaera TaxID=317661 RepID=UPI0016482964|nr:hypothetical protein [Quadrisphaera sp. RL12-1S]MBC3764158.1 hypothetical protein [Quadrisphaera sp. RL12-1S]